MTGRSIAGKIEIALSLASLVFVLAPLLTFAYFAKMSGIQAGGGIPIGTATAKQFESQLHIDAEIASRIVQSRDHARGFESVDSILDISLFTEAEQQRLLTAAASSRLDAQTATPRIFASTLQISLPMAARLAEFRDRSQPSVFAPLPHSASAPNIANLLRKAPLLDAHSTRPLLNRFVVRTAADVARTYWIGVGIYFLAAVLLPVMLRLRRLKADPFLLPISILISGLGVALLFSIKDPLRDRAVYEHHLGGLLFAIAVMALFAYLPRSARSRIRSYQYIWVLAAFTLVLGLFLFGNGPEGVKLNLFHFQPVEAIKLMLVFFLASYLSERASSISDASSPRLSTGVYTRVKRSFAFSLPRRRDLGPLLVMYGFALVLFLVIKDMGPGLLMFGTFVVMLGLTTGNSGYVLIGAVFLISGGFVGYHAHIGVFATRVDMWLHPFANAHANGMQLGQGYWAFASSGWVGSGPGMGMPGLVPRAGSDLAFASWCEETGIAGGCFVLLLYIGLVWRGITVSLRAASDFDRALGLGLTTLFGLQALLILGGVTGAIPLSGISLPFMSYGNSALVASFALIGMLYGISSDGSDSERAMVSLSPMTGAARVFALVYSAVMLIGIGLARLMPLQVFQADSVAVRPILTPDADRVVRPHINPRILAVERTIVRGAIRDANGAVVATSNVQEMTASGLNREKAEQLAASHGRYYPFGSALAHLVGYVDPSVGGPFGLEKAYDADLRGFQREADLLSDYRSRYLPGYRPRRGHDLALTIDAALQRDIHAILDRATLRLTDKTTGRRKDRAAFVLVRPSTGDVIAAVSLPGFDPNGLTRDRLRTLVSGAEADYERPLINRALSGWYPPGSTFKIAVTAVALETLPDAERFTFACNRVSPRITWQAHGSFYSRSGIHDDKGDPAFGSIGLPQAFTVSSNIYFANLAARLDTEQFRARLTGQFGFSHVPRQASFDADLADLGFGQGRMLTSPLEICRLSAAVANGGTMMRTRLVSKIDTFEEDGRAQSDPEKRPRVVVKPPAAAQQSLNASTAMELRSLMARVVDSGTARGVFDDLPFGVAGKTGTAQNRQYDSEPHSWFTGFAPRDGQPRYAFACIVENGGYGKTVAGAVCRDVLKRLESR